MLWLSRTHALAVRPAAGATWISPRYSPRISLYQTHMCTKVLRDWVMVEAEWLQLCAACTVHAKVLVHLLQYARKAEIFQVWWKLCSVQCTSMAPCMRHVPPDIFAPSCCDMHGEYILTPPHSTIAAKISAVALIIMTGF